MTIVTTQAFEGENMIAFLNRPIRIKNLEIKPDVVIMATGSKPAYPPFEVKEKFLTHYEILAK